MVWSAVASLMTVILDLLTARRQTACAKDLEIVLLRHQLRILERRQPRLRLSRWERLSLTLLVTKLRHLTVGARQHWSGSLVLVTPETVLRWHRDLVRRKWTFRRCRRRFASAPRVVVVAMGKCATQPATSVAGGCPTVCPRVRHEGPFR